jgi:hypothetical protein
MQSRIKQPDKGRSTGNSNTYVYICALSLLQEVEATRAACCEGDLLLQEAEGRLAAAQTEAAAAQQQALQVN